MPHMTLYTRPGCHLCEEALAFLEREQECLQFRLSLVDVESDSQLVAEYGDCVPVVSINGKVRFRGVVNAVLLRRLFAAGE